MDNSNSAPQMTIEELKAAQEAMKQAIVQNSFAELSTEAKMAVGQWALNMMSATGYKVVGKTLVDFARANGLKAAGSK